MTNLFANKKAMEELEHLAQDKTAPKAVQEFAKWSLAKFQGKTYKMKLPDSPKALRGEKIAVEQRRYAEKQAKRREGPPVAPGSIQNSAGPGARQEPSSPESVSASPEQKAVDPRDAIPGIETAEIPTSPTIEEMTADAAADNAQTQMFGPDPTEHFKPPVIPKDNIPF